MRSTFRRLLAALRRWRFERQVNFAFYYPASVASRAPATLARYRRRLRTENPDMPAVLLERLARRAARDDLADLARHQPKL